MKSRFTFPFELGYLLSVLRDSELPTRWRFWPLIEFLLLFLDPGGHTDLYFPAIGGFTDYSSGGHWPRSYTVVEYIQNPLRDEDAPNGAQRKR